MIMAISNNMYLLDNEINNNYWIISQLDRLLHHGSLIKNTHAL